MKHLPVLGKIAGMFSGKRLMTLVDRARGLDFLTPILPEQVGLDPHLTSRSTPSGNTYLSDLLRDMGIKESDAIIDIGCGKGSAMRTMLKFPFGKVSGVELSQEIGKIAMNNFALLNQSRANVFIANAIEFDSYHEYNFIYMYNPFPSMVMKEVVTGIRRSIADYEREVVMIYNNPLCHDVIVGQGGFFPIRKYPAEWGNEMFVYSSLPRARSRLATA